MSTFDKSAPAKGTSKGKIVAMIVLGGILAGVVVFHFNNAPKTAVAGEGGADVGGDIQSGAASNQIIALQSNSTAPLLLPHKAGAGADVPGNPFAVTQNWYLGLIRREHFLDFHTQPSKVDPVRPVPVPLDLVKERDGLKLQGIFKESGRRVAIVNGTTVRAGSLVKATTTGNFILIIDVLEDRLQCQVADRDDGKFDLLLSPKLPGN